ncbi:MAG: hypothetical protein K0R14_1444 [Burkholderiales bacterium]|jgi:hypothetical protein|nr:hypothetical protein [Burkholderiales bacterium]
MNNKKNIFKTIKICLSAISIFIISKPASSLDSYSMNINICTKWVERNIARDPACWTDDYPYDCSHPQMFDGLWARYGHVEGIYSGNTIIIPSPTSSSYNCNVAHISLPQRQSFYIDLFANPWSELYLDEFTLGPNLDPAEGVVPIKDRLITISPSDMKSCTIEIEYLINKYLDEAAYGEDILSYNKNILASRHVNTNCIENPNAALETLTCPKPETLVYEASHTSSSGEYIPTTIKGIGEGTVNNYVFKDKSETFLFNPFFDKSDVVYFSGAKINFEKDNSNERVIHCYYKFLNHPQYSKIDLKQKFFHTIDNITKQDVVPIDPLIWAKSTEAFYGDYLPTYTSPSSAETGSPLKVENYKVLLSKYKPN